MVLLEAPPLKFDNTIGDNATDWWSNCFHYYGGWANIEQAIINDWHGRVVYFSGHHDEVFKGIEFNNDSDATAFLLRWS